MTQQRPDELYPWLQNLTGEQCWKIWLAYDRAFNWKGCSPYSNRDHPVTTHDEAVVAIGSFLARTDPSRIELLEDELELSEEYKLSNWMRKLRHSRETAEQERWRYDREDRTAEELARYRQRRRPRS